jgi:hypothetical protein
VLVIAHEPHGLEHVDEVLGHRDGRLEREEQSQWAPGTAPPDPATFRP